MPHLFRRKRISPPDEGNTIPFISRYRKEATGSLNDEQLRDLHERLQYLRNLEDKKQQVLGSIEEQGQLTQELKDKILAAQTLVAVEDLYRPYRPKRKTRASVAREKGLEPLYIYYGLSSELPCSPQESVHCCLAGPGHMFSNIYEKMHTKTVKIR